MNSIKNNVNTDVQNFKFKENTVTLDFKAKTFVTEYPCDDLHVMVIKTTNILLLWGKDSLTMYNLNNEYLESVLRYGGWLPTLKVYLEEKKDKEVVFVEIDYIGDSDDPDAQELEENYKKTPFALSGINGDVNDIKFFATKDFCLFWDLLNDLTYKDENQNNEKDLIALLRLPTRTFLTGTLNTCMTYSFCISNMVLIFKPLQIKKPVIDTPTIAQKDCINGYIYIIKSKTIIKVGFSKNVDRRIKDIERYRGEFKLVEKFKGTLEDEQKIHSLLFSYRIPQSSEYYAVFNLDKIVSLTRNYFKSIKHKCN